MIRYIKNLFIKIMVVSVTTVSVCAPVYAELNLNGGEVGEYGEWATDINKETIVSNIRNEASEFQSAFEREYIETGVPIEARLGIAFINGLGSVTKVLDNSLVRFVNIFLILAYAFWVLFEGYRLATDGKSKAMPVVEEIFKKGIMLVIWLMLLGGGLQQLFEIIMGPIMAFGSYIANMILDGVAEAGNFTISDTCGAIKAYAISNAAPDAPVAPEFAADIMCVPTRMSGFYYAAIKYGLGLALHGIGTSLFTVLVGALLVYLFLKAAFKFAFIAFDVVADLFLTVIMLPFTAIAETLPKTSVKGVAGDIYNGFLGLFKASNVSSQVTRFINAAIYFVALSIVVSIGGALLAGAIELNAQTHVYTVINGDVVTLLLTGALVVYIADHADDIAKTIDGGIKYTADSQISTDIKNFYSGAKERAMNFFKKLKESKAS